MGGRCSLLSRWGQRDGASPALGAQPHACAGPGDSEVTGGLSSPARPQLLLAVCEKSTPIGTSCQGAMLPSITNVINLADSHDRAAFAMVTHVKQEPRERENSESKEEVTPRARAASPAGLPARWDGAVSAVGCSGREQLIRPRLCWKV